MLTPASGVAALQALLYDLTSATVPRAAGVRGAATQTYWRLLITKFKPLPPLFAQIALSVMPLSKMVCNCCLLTSGLTVLAAVSFTLELCY